MAHDYILKLGDKPIRQLTAFTQEGLSRQSENWDKWQLTSITNGVHTFDNVQGHRITVNGFEGCALEIGQYYDIDYQLEYDQHDKVG